MNTNKARLEAYKKILKGIEEGKVEPESSGNPCRYTYKIPGTDRTIYCGVGILFSQTQLEDIIRRGCNSRPVEDLISEFGKLNIVFSTGLDVDDLRELQSEHDVSSFAINGNAKFRQFIEKKIKTLERQL